MRDQTGTKNRNKQQQIPLNANKSGEVYEINESNLV
jgi:hypothetical protein